MEDSSTEILQRYFGKNKVLRIELADGLVLYGIFVGFFHGDAEQNETDITAWRLIPESDIDDYNHSPEKYIEIGKVIQHSQIRKVEFK